MNTQDRFSLQGKVAVITGGERLYGKSASAGLCDMGAKLYIACPFVKEAETVAEEIRQSGGDATAIEYNQAEESSIKNLCAAVLEREGRIDILVNAARVIATGSGWRQGLSDLELALKVNTLGLLLVTREVGAVMMKQAAGSIINIASMMGNVGVEPTNYHGFPDMLAGCFGHDYYFVKSGIIAFTKQAASYYGRYGVRVNCISPGGIQSERTPDGFVLNYARHTMLARMANDEDLKGVVAFLASEASSYITGVNLPMDGGYIHI